jgi:hypothetical protein
MTSPSIAYLAGIATVIVSLVAGFAGGAALGTYWGPKQRPAIAQAEHPSMATVQRREMPREIPIVQQTLAPSSNEQISAAKAQAAKAQAAKAQTAKLAEARKIAAQRKVAAAERRIARAERREAERQRQQALAAVGQPKEFEQPLTPALGPAPVAGSLAPPKEN